MEVLRIREPQTLRPVNIVTIVVMLATLAGACLLLSAAESARPVDGAIEWREDSPLRAVVRLLCLNYEYPTLHQGDVKTTILGFGAGLAVICLGMAMLVAPREPLMADAVHVHADGKKHIPPLLAAQVMYVLFVLWSFASTRWSAAPDLSLGGAALLAVLVLWALCLGHGMNRKAAIIACHLVVAIAALTSLVAIWYYFGRNPNLRAKFPFGNPTFLAGALIPGLTLAIVLALRHWQHARDLRQPSAFIAPLLLTAGAVIITWAFLLTGSRGAGAGAVLALLATCFFAVRGRLKLIPAVLALIVAVAGVFLAIRAAGAPSETGRDATLRFRLYAMDYAFRMFQDRPLTGHGQGAFTLMGDNLAVGDVLNEPLVLQSRIAHAHNEWFEVLAELGAPGLVLLAAALVLTLRSASVFGPGEPDERMARAALAGALFGLIVDATAGTGLRLSVAPVFYTVLGLLWAMSGTHHTNVLARLSGSGRARYPLGAICLALGAGCLAMTRNDFLAARAAYDAEIALSEARYDEAIDLARASRDQLNPQRAVTNRIRYGRALIMAARFHQERALDRLARAENAGDLGQLRALASIDIEASRDLCQHAGEVISNLVKSAPDFLNQGYFVYLLNATLARDPESRERGALYEDAAQTALERELHRQPFSAGLAMDWARVAAGKVEPETCLHILARPLRFRGMTAGYGDLLQRLAGDAAFEEGLSAMMNAASRTRAEDIPRQGDDIQRWSPEILRLGATLEFMRGRYDLACAALVNASRKYEVLDPGTSIGKASAYLELAISNFYLEPLEPASSLAFAQQARHACPPSVEGRAMKNNVVRREVDFLLADGREEDAVAMLREHAQINISREMMESELAARYLELCDMLLRRRQSELFRVPPNDLMPRLMSWVQRAIALRPDLPDAHYMAADLELHQGNIEASVAYLREARRLGFPLGTLLEYVRVALEQHPGHAALEALYAEFDAQAQSGISAGTGNPQPPPG